MWVCVKAWYNQNGICYGDAKKSKDPRTLLLMLLFARVRTATIEQSFTPSQVQMPKVLTAFFKASESDDDDSVEGHPGLLFERGRSSAQLGFVKSMAYELHVSLSFFGKFSFLTNLNESNSFIQQLPL